MPDGVGGRPSVLMTTDAVGGVWRYTLDLAAGFAARGVGAVLAVLGPAPDVAQRAEAAGFALVETGLALDWTAEGPGELAGAARALQGLAARLGVASVHLHAPALAGSGGWTAPVVAVAHSCVATWWLAVRGGPLPEDFRWRTEAARAGLEAADAVIAPSAAHAAAVREVYGKVGVQVVHNGSAWPDEPSPSGRGLGEGLATLTPPLSRRERENRGQRERAVLTAGRLWDEGKGAAALDRVAPELGAPIRAAGPVRGPNGATVELPNLELLGNLDRAALARAYAGASVFASMARYEPFGLSVLEAARAGMRLVLSDIPSFRELWDRAAIFVRDEAELLPVLREALERDGDGGARERAQRYTVDAMVEGTLAVHRHVGALV